MAIDIEYVKNASPIERILSELIEAGKLSVLVDELCTEAEIENIIASVYRYRMVRNEDFRLFLIDKLKLYKRIQKTAKQYTVAEYISFVEHFDNDILLSCFLGCDVLLTNDPSSNCSKLAQELYIPRICISNDREYGLHQGTIWTGSDPSDICAALLVMKDRTYSEELSGLQNGGESDENCNCNSTDSVC